MQLIINEKLTGDKLQPSKSQHDPGGVEFAQMTPKQPSDIITLLSQFPGTCRASFYLLVRPVFWSEVTARLLEPQVEMWKFVQQVHPPWWSVANHRCHGEQMSIRST